MPDRLATSLFRRHVLRSARDDSCLCEAGIVGRTGEPEVRQLNSFHSVGQQDVGRLDVAMDEPLCMSGREPCRRLHSNSQNLNRFQCPFLIEPPLQRRARHVGHDEVRQSVCIGHAVNLDDVVVYDCCRGLSFSRESLSRRAAASQMRCQNFDGHVSVQSRIKRLQHNTHSAGPDDSRDFVGAQGGRASARHRSARAD